MVELHQLEQLIVERLKKRESTINNMIHNTLYLLQYIDGLCVHFLLIIGFTPNKKLNTLKSCIYYDFFQCMNITSFVFLMCCCINSCVCSPAMCQESLKQSQWDIYCHR